MIARACCLSLLLVGCGHPPAGRPPSPAAERVERLFNGRDLDGWEPYVGPPGRDQPPYGLNNDPKRVFSVVEVDGAPAIRVSGEMFGALTTRAEYENYRLRLEYKWGTKRWPPRQNSV